LAVGTGIIIYAFDFESGARHDIAAKITLKKAWRCSRINLLTFNNMVYNIFFIYKVYLIGVYDENSNRVSKA
jgi:hypothetical protein